MPKPDYNKVSQLFDPFDNSSDIKKPAKTKNNPTNKRKNNKTSSMKNNKTRFLEKFEDEMYQDFDEKDWFQYFVFKFEEENNRKFLARNYAKDYAIIKSLMKELSWMDVKSMIDFIFESDQDIMDKRTVGVAILSKGWINTIYQNTQLWLEGDYKPKKGPKHNREYVEASKKDAGTGIHYGKPVRDKEELQEKRKKSKIRF